MTVAAGTSPHLQPARPESSAYDVFGQVRSDSFLGRLRNGDIDLLMSVGVKRVWEPGDVMLRQGAAPPGIHVLLRGAAKEHTVAPDGHPVILFVRSSGETLGVNEVLQQHAPTHMCTAVTQTVTFFVTARDARHASQTSTHVAAGFAEVMARRISKLEEEVLWLSAGDCQQRILRRIVQLGDLFGEQRSGRLEVDVPLTQRELGAWAGASRESTARILHQLRSMQLIETSRHHLSVLDLDAVHRLLACGDLGRAAPGRN